MAINQTLTTIQQPLSVHTPQYTAGLSVSLQRHCLIDPIIRSGNNGWAGLFGVVVCLLLHPTTYHEYRHHTIIITILSRIYGTVKNASNKPQQPLSDRNLKIEFYRQKITPQQGKQKKMAHAVIYHHRPAIQLRMRNSLNNQRR